MGYLRGYDWDVFVSYARHDDVPLLSGERGWVSTFVNALRVGIKTYLGHEAKLFFDLSAVHPGEDELEDLKKAAARSALMVVIASPTYCMREWTLAELSTFCAACPDSRRLLVIERLPLDSGDRWPDTIDRKIRLQFWEDLPNMEAKAPLSPSSSEYHPKVLDFAHRLQKQLREIRHTEGEGESRQRLIVPGGTEAVTRITPQEAAGARAAPITIKDPSSRIGVGGMGAEPSPPLPARHRRTVLIAPATPDVAAEAKSVRRHLAQFPDAVEVVPEFHEAGAHWELAASFEGDLRGADVVVQLLGADPGGAAPGDASTSFIEYQLQRARAAGKTILTWRHPELRVDEIENESHRALIDEPAVLVCGLAQFMRHVLDAATAGDAPQPVHDEKRVFINADRDNLVTAEAIAQEFAARKYAPTLPKFDGTTSENRSHLYRMMTECGVVVVVNGIRPPIWFHNQKRLFETLRAQRARDPDGLAVCTVPPADELNPELVGNEFYHIDCSDGFDSAQVRSFIAMLKQRQPPVPPSKARPGTETVS